MKKVVTVVAVIFCTIVFTSCTDETKELENLKYDEFKLYDKNILDSDREDEEKGDD